MSHTEALEEATYTLVDSNDRVVGICFRAPVLNADYPGTFLLTAGHSLRAEQRRSGKIRVVRSASGDDHSASIVVSDGLGTGPDVGLLYVSRRLGQPLTLTGLVTPGAVRVRGAPAGVATEQASFVGEVVGEEWHSVDGLVVDVVLHELGWLERSRKTSEPLVTDEASSLAYASLRGLSGAPVWQEQGDGDTRVCAMIVRRNTAGLANRVYGIPVSTIHQYLSAAGFPLQIVHSGASYQMSGSVTALTGRVMQRLLRTPGGASQLWDEVSELFYMGLPVDHVLREALREPRKYHLDSEIHVSQIEFLLGRLLFKRGRAVEARRHLRQAANRARRDPTPDHLELGALVNLRLMLEGGVHDVQVNRRREEFKSAMGRYESVGPSSDNDRAYELASALGREASLLPDSGGLSGGESGARDYFSWLSTEHEQLLEAYPETLIGKQEVVQIALAVLSTLYGIDEVQGSERLEQLDAHIRRGVAAALQRDNAIFFIQMMVAAGVMARARGEEIAAFKLACCAAGVLRRGGLGLDHEGVSFLIGYLNAAEPILAAVVQSVFNLDVVDGVSQVIGMGSEVGSVHASALIAAAEESSQWLNRTRNLLDVFDLDIQNMG